MSEAKFFQAKLAWLEMEASGFIWTASVSLLLAEWLKKQNGATQHRGAKGQCSAKEQREWKKKDADTN